MKRNKRTVKKLSSPRTSVYYTPRATLPYLPAAKLCNFKNCFRFNFYLLKKLFLYSLSAYRILIFIIKFSCFPSSPNVASVRIRTGRANDVSSTFSQCALCTLRNVPRVKLVKNTNSLRPCPLWVKERWRIWCAMACTLVNTIMLCRRVAWIKFDPGRREENNIAAVNDINWFRKYIYRNLRCNSNHSSPSSRESTVTIILIIVQHE